MSNCRPIRVLLWRELYGYFCTPIAYIFLIIFLSLLGIFTFGDNLGAFYERGIADLSVAFFTWHPWLFMVFVPAVGMRLWSEELEHGTFELLTTLPTKLWHAIVAKFLAGSLVLALALVLTSPVVVTVNYLGEPDNGKILCGYLGSLLMAASFLSLSSFTSACTRNQVVSFIVSLVICLLLILMGFPPIVNMLRQILPEFLTQLISSWSIYTYFDGLQRGMLDTRDLAYFACLIAFGITSTWLVLKRPRAVWLRIGCLAVVLWAIVVVCSQHHVRLDLTRDKRHTLSEGTLNIIERLKEPVTITFYFSRSEKTVPQPVKDFARRVDGLLNQIDQSSGNTIIVRRIDAQPETAIEDTLMLLGIEPQSLSDENTYFFMGIEVASGSNSAVLPYLDMNKEQNLEFQLARTLQNIAGGDRKTIGVISGLPIMGSMDGNPFSNRSNMRPWLFIRELKKDYTIKEIPTDFKSLPDNLDMLMLFHPRDLTPAGLFVVDQYLLGGGNLVVLVDPMCSVEINSRGRFSKPDPTQFVSTLEPLFQSWGVAFDTDSVVVDPGYSVEQATGDEPAYLELDSEAMSREDVISSALDRIRLPYCGYFVCKPSADITVTPLIASSENARVLLTKDIINERDLTALIEGAPSAQRLLALKLTGQFPTAFPDGSPDHSEPGTPQLKRSTKAGSVVLVGDVDFLEERIWSHRTFNRFTNRESLEITHDNNTFIQNACEQLSGGDDLISIRSRTDLPRFTRINRMWQDADERLRSEILTLNAAYKDTQRRLKALKSRYTGQTAYIESPEELKEREILRSKLLEIVDKLKSVKRERRRDIDLLGAYLLWINVGLTPLLVALSGIGVALWRRVK